MSLMAMSWAFERRGLTPVQKVVLLALADYANDDGECWPGQVSIAEKADLSERTVRSALRALEEMGILRSDERRRPDGYRSSNLYTLAISPARSAGESDSHRQESAPHRQLAAGQEPSVEPPVVNTRAREADDGFDAVWKAWPRKVKKVAAESAWKKLSRADRDAVLASIAAHANGYRQHVELQFTPHLSSWLNQRRWEEDPPQPPTVRARQAPSQLPASETSLLPKYDYTDQIGEDEWGFPVYRRIN